MDFDYSKLRGLIREKFKTEKVFAEHIGLTNASISSKLNGKTIWTQKDIEKACQALGIPYNLIPEYFFNKK